MADDFASLCDYEEAYDNRVLFFMGDGDGPIIVLNDANQQIKDKAEAEEGENKTETSQTDTKGKAVEKSKDEATGTTTRKDEQCSVTISVTDSGFDDSHVSLTSTVSSGIESPVLVVSDASVVQEPPLLKAEKKADSNICYDGIKEHGKESDREIVKSTAITVEKGDKDKEKGVKDSEKGKQDNSGYQVRVVEKRVVTEQKTSDVKDVERAFYGQVVPESSVSTDETNDAALSVVLAAQKGRGKREVDHWFKERSLSCGEYLLQGENRKNSIEPQEAKPMTKEEIMKMFEESEQLFQTEILSSLPHHETEKEKLKRSFSSSPTRSGTEHLNNLVRIMEKISHLTEENTDLKKKCGYLENTKSVLQAQNKVLKTDKRVQRTRSKHKDRRSLAHSKSQGSGEHHARNRERERLRRSPSSSSDIEQKDKEQSSKPKRAQRSQSVGSIGIDDLVAVEESRLRNKRHSQFHKIKDSERFKDMFSKSRITSKWERVKKVFQGKPEPASTNVEQLVRANSRPGGSFIPPDLPPVKSVEGPGYSSSSPTETTDKNKLAAKHIHTYVEPPSPSSVNSEPAIPSVITYDNDLYEDIGPPRLDKGTEADVSANSLFSDDRSGDVVVTSWKETKHVPLTTKSDDEKSRSNFLSVQENALMVRRKSSPTLSMFEEEDHKDIDACRSSSLKRTGMRRSSSFKAQSSPSRSEGLDHAESRESLSRGKCQQHHHRSAWGRVKDIIHTRKDSLKRSKRSHSAGDSLPDAGSTSDGGYYFYDDDQWEMDTECHSRPSSPRQSRKDKHDSQVSPLDTPGVSRRQGKKSRSASPPGKRDSTALALLSTSPVDVSALIGGVSEEFFKKLNEWEEKKRKSFMRETSTISTWEDDGSGGGKFSKEFIRKMEEWERMKGLSSPKSKSNLREGTQSPDLGSQDCTCHSPDIDELPKNLSESFSKTVQEWERIKTQRIKDTGSPTPESKPHEGRKSRKQERSKSRERDRSRHKFERQREKELQKIEKKEQKIEKERQKVEKMRQKLDDLAVMGDGKTEYKAEMSQEFARKLHEWEVMKGLKPTSPQPAEHHAENTTTIKTFTISHNRANTEGKLSHLRQVIHKRSNSAKHHKERAQSSRERTKSEGRSDESPGPNGKKNINNSKSAPASPGARNAGSSSNSPESRRSSKVEDLSSRSTSLPQFHTYHGDLVDESTSMDLNLTADPSVISRSASHSKLMEELHQKDEEILACQDEIQQVTERINMMNKQHSEEIENYKRELWAMTRLGKYTIESDLFRASIRDVKGKLGELRKQQELLQGERDHLAEELKQEVQARRAVEERMAQHVKKLPLQAPDAEIDEEVEKLCEFFCKLQVQLGELKLGVTVRNKILGELQRHLLSQEVTNRLLRADMQRRDLELRYFRQARRGGVIKRWKTFGGADFITRGDPQEPEAYPKYTSSLPRAMEESLHQLQRWSDTPDTGLDWTWLDRLKRHKTKIKDPLPKENETQTEVKHLSDNTAQTVMTLCNVPYSVPSKTPTSRTLCVTGSTKASTASSGTTTVTSTATQPSPTVISVVPYKPHLASNFPYSTEKHPAPPERHKLSKSSPTEEASTKELAPDTTVTASDSTRTVIQKDVLVQTSKVNSSCEVMNMDSTTSQGVSVGKVEPLKPAPVENKTSVVQKEVTASPKPEGKLPSSGIVNVETRQVKKEVGATAYLDSQSHKSESASPVKEKERVTFRTDEVTVTTAVTKTKPVSIMKDISKTKIAEVKDKPSGGGVVTMSQAKSISSTDDTSSKERTASKDSPLSVTAVVQTKEFPSSSTESKVTTTTVQGHKSYTIKSITTKPGSEPVRPTSSPKTPSSPKRADEKTYTEPYRIIAKVDTTPSEPFRGGSETYMGKIDILDGHIKNVTVSTPVGTVETPVRPPRRKHSSPTRIRKGSASGEGETSSPVLSPVNIHKNNNMTNNLSVQKPVSPVSKPESPVGLTPTKSSIQSDEAFKDMLAKTPQPPHSPIIRSRNPRKLKTDIRSAQVLADSRAWKATPPKRYLRHRRPSTEKKPETDDNHNTENVSDLYSFRQRAKSDSACQKDTLPIPSPDYESGESAELKEKFVFRYQKENRNMPVHEAIQKFEKGDNGGKTSLRGRSMSPSTVIRKPAVSPVRHLKTAAELLHESEIKYNDKKRSRSTTRMDEAQPKVRMDMQPRPRSTGAATSPVYSDKENFNRDVRHTSRETTPEPMERNTAQRTPLHGPRKLFMSSPSPDRGKGALQDLTNNKSEDQKKVGETPGTRNRQGLDMPKEGIVSKNAGIFQSRIDNSGVKVRHSAPSSSNSDIESIGDKLASSPVLPSDSPGVDKDEGVTEYKSESLKSASEFRSLFPPSTFSGPSSPTSPPKDRKVHRLFGRKHGGDPASSSLSPSSSRGAISSLCNQAMCVTVTEGSSSGSENNHQQQPRPPAEGGSSPDTAASTPERRRGVSKFFDANWLQKPKKFFKVSK